MCAFVPHQVTRVRASIAATRNGASIGLLASVRAVVGLQVHALRGGVGATHHGTHQNVARAERVGGCGYRGGGGSAASIGLHLRFKSTASEASQEAN